MTWADSKSHSLAVRSHDAVTSLVPSGSQSQLMTGAKGWNEQMTDNKIFNGGVKNEQGDVRDTSTICSLQNLLYISHCLSIFYFETVTLELIRNIFERNILVNSNITNDIVTTISITILYSRNKKKKVTAISWKSCISLLNFMNFVTFRKDGAH